MSPQGRAQQAASLTDLFETDRLLDRLAARISLADGAESGPGVDDAAGDFATEFFAGEFGGPEDDLVLSLLSALATTVDEDLPSAVDPVATAVLAARYHQSSLDGLRDFRSGGAAYAGEGPYDRAERHTEAERFGDAARFGDATALHSAGGADVVPDDTEDERALGVVAGGRGARPLFLAAARRIPRTRTHRLAAGMATAALVLTGGGWAAAASSDPQHAWGPLRPVIRALHPGWAESSPAAKRQAVLRDLDRARAQSRAGEAIQAAETFGAAKQKATDLPSGPDADLRARLDDVARELGLSPSGDSGTLPVAAPGPPATTLGPPASVSAPGTDPTGTVGLPGGTDPGSVAPGQGLPGDGVGTDPTGVTPDPGASGTATGSDPGSPPVGAGVGQNNGTGEDSGTGEAVDPSSGDSGDPGSGGDSSGTVVGAPPVGGSSGVVIGTIPSDPTTADPSDPAATDPADPSDPTTTDPTTTDPTTTDPTTTDPGQTGSGTTDSGTTGSGTTGSGTTGSGTTGSGTTDSGSTDSGSTDSGSTDSGSTTSDPGSSAGDHGSDAGTTTSSDDHSSDSASASGKDSSSSASTSSSSGSTSSSSGSTSTSSHDSDATTSGSAATTPTADATSSTTGATQA